MKFRLFSIVIVFLLGLNSGVYGSEWQRLEINNSVNEANSVIIDIGDPRLIYAGFKDGLYKSGKRGRNWELLGEGAIRDINFILIDKQDKQIIYSATKNGLFRSQDGGVNWQKIFTGKDVLERDIRGLALLFYPPKVLFIATRAGVFFSPVNRIVWQKLTGKLGDSAIAAIVCDPNLADGLYIVSSRELFKSKNRGSSYERLYVGFDPESEDALTDIDSSEEEVSEDEYFLRHMAIDPENRNNLYLATSRGLLFSQDAGKTWEFKNLYGLLSRKINYVLVSGTEGRFFLATDNGVFDCSGDRCRQLYQGMDFKDCKFLDRDIQGNLYVASDKGVFRISLKAKGGISQASPQSDRDRSNREPAIQEVQKEAIRYAEVYPEKILAWRRQARLRAFIPQLTLDYDKTVTTALGATYDRVQVGPRDWGLSLKWDLADLIFSTDQTSIDVRSRLMVQLRDDLLNEVNRLYFERKRLKVNLAVQGDLDAKSRLEKEFRLEELTAFLDGLTGGYLTRCMTKIEEE